MNSHLSEEQISEWIAGQRGGEADQHMRECPQCAAEIERTGKALLLFRNSGYACAEYWRMQPTAKSQRRVSRWTIAATGAAILAILAAAIILHRPPARPPQAQPAQEVFLRVPYVVPPAPYERTEIVRMDVPVAALIAAGFRMTAPAGDSVPADVLVGQDGRPLAVGFPEDRE
jgi:hypothetical protein